MRRYVVRYTPEAKADVLRLERDLEEPWRRSARPRSSCGRLRTHVVAYRTKLRDLLVRFGGAGYVVRFELEPPRPQRDDP